MQYHLRAKKIESKHGFSLRTGSEADFEREAGFSRPPLTVKQVHEHRVLRLDAPEDALEGENKQQADALITDVPGLAIAVMTADCVPILLEDPATGAVAAVHAGWRGTVQRIVMETIEAMKREYGTRPEDLRAAIGPAIGACCYEIGPEVIRELEKLPGANACLLPGEGEKAFADLRGFNAFQLQNLGVASIELVGECTRCREDLFYSYRRNGPHAGRMLAAIERT
ncbi:MAG: peptidoglycan editing factor PgeF [Bacteroidota bacterium]